MAPQPVNGLVFITGASSGIGQALAWRYYQAGYALALVARRGVAIQSWADARQFSPERCRVYAADVSDPTSIVAAAQACLARQGLPDVVIANAGISVGMDTRQREDIEVMSRVFATNNIGMAATFQPFVAPMVRRGHGTLVGIASVAGVRGLPGHGAYCASKAAVISYCESLRGELKRSGIRVVTLSPGYIDTPLTRANRYAMPFLMKPERFAEKAFEAIAAGASYRVIPWQMGVLGKLLRVLPNWLFDRVLAGRARKHRQNSHSD
jgi:short-subunit dehydrogenase